MSVAAVGGVSHSSPRLWKCLRHENESASTVLEKMRSVKMKCILSRRHQPPKKDISVRRDPLHDAVRCAGENTDRRTDISWWRRIVTNPTALALVERTLWGSASNGWAGI
jgi:hypothetical protein